MTKQHEQARQWRIRRGFSVDKLAELTGYSREAIYAMERGESTRAGAGKVKEWVWHRYKMCCAGVDAQIRSGLNFDWGH
ncbi:MAG TPA: helix-turn-helix transcriptional regulator [Candidatus Acidoferrum sp.]|nr:helix-turn-helix transcriptional regulator [Candidatus Acidoferrum sp.]